MIKQWLEEYKPKNQAEAEQALREIMQEIALAGLQRSGFFEKAAFYGGTALRIFYDLERYSEDLDFSLLEVNPDFSLKPYLEGIMTEFNALGMQVSIKEKLKTNRTNIDSAFLKSDTVWKELVLEDIIPQADLAMRPGIKIKLEVDTEPPLGFSHFLIRAIDTGDWKKKAITKEEFIQLLENKIKEISFKSVRDDIVRFVHDDKVLDIWSASYFNDLIKKVKFL